MYRHTTWRLLVVLLAATCTSPAWADLEVASRPAGLHEIPDAELGAMRGRYIVGDDRVAWFGVTMVSDWLTASGQRLQGKLALGFDLRGVRPDVTFQPSVTITDGTLPAVTAGNGTVEAGGLANVGGLVQAVQVAGDGNTARNGLALRIRDGAILSGAAGTGAASAEAGAAGAQARAALDDAGARVLLQVAGQGAVEQWIDARAIGQSIRLTGDGHAVGNRLQLDLVRQSAPAAESIHRNLVQAIGMNRAGGL